MIWIARVEEGGVLSLFLHWLLSDRTEFCIFHLFECCLCGLTVVSISDRLVHIHMLLEDVHAVFHPFRLEAL